MEITYNGCQLLGICSMDNIEDFNAMMFELKQEHGYKKVFFDRDYELRRIIFFKS